MIMLSVDPGVLGTGYACWSNGRYKACGVLLVKSEFKENPWAQRAEQIARAYEKLLSEIVSGYGDKIGKIVMEFPAFMGGSGGRAVAARGDLVKLAVLTGMLGMSSLMAAYSFQYVEVSKWKGQLPKSVCEARVRKLLPELPPKVSNHAIDAIGIGLWALGKF